MSSVHLDPSRRLAHYFASVGLSPELSAKVRTLAQRDSNSQLGLVDGIHIWNGDPNSVPDDLEVIELTVAGHSANISTGVLRNAKPAFLAISRSTDKQPITSLDLIDSRDAIIQPKPGFMTLLKDIGRKKMELAVEKHPFKDPIASVVLINRAKNEQCPKGYVEIEPEIEVGIFGGDIFKICYRSVPKDKKTYAAQVLDRYPCDDLEDYPFPDVVPEFCFPFGIQISDQIKIPEYFGFVFTTNSGTEIYGNALLFYEPLTENQYDLLQVPNASKRKKELFAPKCVVILSHWPFFNQFERFLVQLHRIVLSPSHVPLERYLETLFHEIRVPHPSSAIQFKIGHTMLEFSRPPLLSLPLSDIPLKPLFRCLDIPSIVSLIELLLSESKIILYSDHISALLPVAESIRSLLFPLQWHAVFIPVLPMMLWNVTQAPFPFLVGMHRSFLDELRISPDVTTVDLDSSCIHFGTTESSKNSRAHFFPEKLRNKLVKDLSSFSEVYHEGEFDIVASLHAPRPPELFKEEIYYPLEIRATFIRLFVELLQNYSHFLSSRRGYQISSLNSYSRATSEFDHIRFLAQFESETKRMMSRLVDTQLFTQFLFQRMSSKAPFQLIFFDLCIELYKENSENFVSNLIPFLDKKLTQIPENIFSVSSLEEGLLRENPQSKSSLFVHNVFPKIEIRRFSSKVLLTPLYWNMEDDFDQLFSKKDAMHLERTWHLLSEKIMSTGIISPSTPSHTWVLKSSEAIYRAWFLLYLEHSRTKCKSRDCQISAYKDFLLALCILYRMLNLGHSLCEHVAMSLLRYCICTSLLNPFRKIYGLFFSSGKTLSLKSFRDIFSLHIQYATYPTYPCSCGNINRSSQVVLLENKIVPEDSLEYFTRVCVELPLDIKTEATCSTCSHNLSGEEILNGWVGSNRKDTKCPMCHADVAPLLLLRHHSRLIPGTFAQNSVPYARPSLVLENLEKEIELLSTHSDPILNIRLNPHLFWNLSYWFSTQNLPYQFLLGFADHPNLRTPFRYRTPFIEPWSICFCTADSRSIDISSNSIQETLSEMPGEYIEKITESLKASNIRTACEEFLFQRSLANLQGKRFLNMGMYTALSVLNKRFKIHEPFQFSKQLMSELRNSMLECAKDVQQCDQPYENGFPEQIFELINAIQQNRSRLMELKEPSCVSALLALYMDLAFSEFERKNEDL